MKDLAYGKGYKYAHDVKNRLEIPSVLERPENLTNGQENSLSYKDTKVDQEHFPPELKGRKYYNEKRDKNI